MRVIINNLQFIIYSDSDLDFRRFPPKRGVVTHQKTQGRRRSTRNQPGQRAEHLPGDVWSWREAAERVGRETLTWKVAGSTLLGTDMSHPSRHCWVDDFPIPKVGYLSFAGGYAFWANYSDQPAQLDRKLEQTNWRVGNVLTLCLGGGDWKMMVVSLFWGGRIAPQRVREFPRENLPNSLFSSILYKWLHADLPDSFVV